MSNTSPTLAQLEQKDTFIRRHIGPGKGEIEEMLSAIGASSLDDLIEQTVPAGIALPEPLKCGEGATEVEALSEVKFECFCFSIWMESLFSDSATEF